MADAKAGSGHQVLVRTVAYRARAYLGTRRVAESGDCLLIEETGLEDRLYFPVDDVDLGSLAESRSETTCRYKGTARYWRAGAPHDVDGADVAWAYPDPIPGMERLASHLCFYHERVRVVAVETWEDGSEVETRFPLWGDVRDLTAMMDPQDAGEGGAFVSPRGPRTARDVIEGGQLLGTALVASARRDPEKAVTSATCYFLLPASFAEPVAVATAPVRLGRSFSTVRTDLSQGGRVCATALVQLDGGGLGPYALDAAMPEVEGPEVAAESDFGTTGRQFRVVGDAYGQAGRVVGEPELDVWVRYRDRPADDALAAALLVQPLTHWTIAASMRGQDSVTEDDAHVGLSTGVLTCTVHFSERFDPQAWHLYSTRAVSAHRGLAGGQGTVFHRDGTVVATFSVQAMVRAFDRDPAPLLVERPAGVM
ncbi:hypothetical protein GCM10009836_24570 [Pseudonocardia ailaonensis]|uniref:Acyl-CoA thioesterase n=1 Tax=Pseudonocardia ailaonensis TaxID=367279 RepID=A0ABN2MYT9_9PSEU